MNHQTISNLFIFFIILISIFFSTSLANQWAKTYDYSLTEDAEDVKQTVDNGFIVVGYSCMWIYCDYWVLKLNQEGNVQWEKLYGGSYDEEAHFVQQTEDGGYIVAGYTESFGKGGKDIWILKIDKNGNLEWQKTYGTSKDDFINSLQITEDGGYILAGYTMSSDEADYLVVKLNRDGLVQWQKIYGGVGLDKATYVFQTRDKGFIISGITSSFGMGDTDILIIKISKNGDIEWQKTYGTENAEWVNHIRQTYDGGYILGGNTQFSDFESGDAYVLKLKSSGDIAWQKTYGGSQFDNIISIQETEDGYVVSGNTWSFGHGKEDLWLFKINVNGEIIWQKTYGGEKIDSLGNFQKILDGGFIIVSRSDTFDKGGYFDTTGSDLWILKTDKDGNIPNCSYSKNSNAQVNNGSAIALDSNVEEFDANLVVTDTDDEPYNVKDINESKICYYRTPKSKVKVKKEGTGDGTIIGTQFNINCGKKCSTEVDKYSNLKLEVFPSIDSDFVGWKDDCSQCGSSYICTLTIQKDTVCTAEFKEKQEPVLSYKPVKIDFGNYELGDEPDEEKVNIYNQGKGNLILYTVKLTGDTENFEISKDKCSGKILKKGKKCEVKIKFKPLKVGNKSANLEVKTNISDSSIEITGSVNPVLPGKVSVSSHILNFGSYGVEEESKKQKLKVKNFSNLKNSKLIISSVSIRGLDKENFSIYKDNCSGSILKKGKSCEIQVLFKPTSVGDKTSVLVVGTNDENLPEEIVDLIGRGEDGEISIQPKDYNFGSTGIGTDDLEKKKFNIKNNGQGILVISDINLRGIDKDNFVLTEKCIGRKLNRGKSCKLQVLFKPLSIGNKSVKVEVKSNDSDRPIIFITLTGKGEGGSIYLKSKEQNFGEVEIGDDKKKKIKVKNVGLGVLSINQIKITGQDHSDFYIKKDRCSGKIMKRGKSCEVEVIFKPVSTGIKIAKLEISSDDSDKPFVEVNISGTGKNP